MSSYDQEADMSTLSAALGHPANATLANIHPDLIAGSHGHDGGGKMNGAMYVSPDPMSDMDLDTDAQAGAAAAHALAQSNGNPPDWPNVLAYTPGVGGPPRSKEPSPPVVAEKHKVEESAEPEGPPKKKTRSRKSSAKSKAAMMIEEGQPAEYEAPSGDFREGAIFVHALPNTVQACMRCHMVKRKCDNVRPRCAGCLKADEPCAYEMSPATTTFVSNLKDETFLLRQELDSTKAKLLATKVELEALRAGAGLGVVPTAGADTLSVNGNSPPLRPATPAIMVVDADAGDAMVAEVIAEGDPGDVVVPVPEADDHSAAELAPNVSESTDAVVVPETTDSAESAVVAETSDSSDTAVVPKATDTAEADATAPAPAPASTNTTPTKDSPTKNSPTKNSPTERIPTPPKEDEPMVEYEGPALPKLYQQFLNKGKLRHQSPIERSESVRERTHPSPSRADLFVAANAWFETYHLTQPFLNKAEFMVEVENVWDRHSKVVDGIPEWNGAGHVEIDGKDSLALVVLAAGAMIAEGTDRLVMGIGKGLLAMGMEAMPELIDGPNDILTVQTLLAFLNTLLVEPSPEYDTEDVLALCVSTARGIGLFRLNDEQTKLTDPALAQKRDALAWSVYGQERMVVTSLDFDFLIADADMMAPMPEPHDSYHCAIWRHRRLMGQITDLHRRAGFPDAPPIDLTAVERLQTELDKWLAAWPHATDGQDYARLLYLKSVAALLYPCCIADEAPLEQIERLYDFCSEALQIYTDKVDSNIPSLVTSMQRFRICTTLLWTMLIRLQRVDNLKDNEQFRADVIDRIEQSRALLCRSRKPDDEFSTLTAVQVTQAEYANLFDRLAVVLLTRYNPNPPPPAEEPAQPPLHPALAPVPEITVAKSEPQDQYSHVYEGAPTPRVQFYESPRQALSPRQILSPRQALSPRQGMSDQSLLSEVNALLVATTSPRTSTAHGSRAFNLHVPSSASGKRLQDLSASAPTPESAPTPSPLHEQAAPLIYSAPTPEAYGPAYFGSAQ